MPIEWTTGYCRTCRSVQWRWRRGVDHTWHVVLTFITGGAWMIAWAIACMTVPPWRCSVCGSAARARKRRSMPTWAIVLIVSCYLAGVVALAVYALCRAR